jgi:hypothetical protein
MNTNKILISAISLIALSVFLGSSFVLLAQIPKTEKDIPIYLDAKRDANKESELITQMSWDMDQSLRSGVLKVYKVGASTEDVFNFYLQKIGGKEGMMDIDPMGIKPGAVSQVRYEVEYYKDEEFTDYSIEYEIKHPGTWMKQKLTENRKPHKPGKWIVEARFNWYKKESNNDLTTFYVIIHDESFGEQTEKKYKTSTEFQIQVTTSKSEQAMREENEEEMEKQTTELSKSLRGKPPTEKELGVPVYPGATFDAESSAGMSAGNDYAIYIYLTLDQPSKVAAFYEQKLKIKPVEADKDQYMIPIKGKMPIPDEGISIQPNTMFGGDAKTVISIQKMIGKSQ